MHQLLTHNLMIIVGNLSEYWTELQKLIQLKPVAGLKFSKWIYFLLLNTGLGLSIKKSLQL